MLNLILLLLSPASGGPCVPKGLQSEGRRLPFAIPRRPFCKCGPLDFHHGDPSMVVLSVLCGVWVFSCDVWRGGCPQAEADAIAAPSKRPQQGLTSCSVPTLGLVLHHTQPQLPDTPGPRHSQQQLQRQALNLNLLLTLASLGTWILQAGSKQQRETFNLGVTVVDKACTFRAQEILIRCRITPRSFPTCSTSCIQIALLQSQKGSIVAYRACSCTADCAPILLPLRRTVPGHCPRYEPLKPLKHSGRLLAASTGLGALLRPPLTMQSPNLRAWPCQALTASVFILYSLFLLPPPLSPSFYSAVL